MALKEKSKAVFNFVAANDGKDISVEDIAKALGVSGRSINGSLTSLQRHKEGTVVEPLIERVKAEYENEDGTHTPVTLVKLTEFGRTFDPDAEDPTDIAK